MSSPKVTVISCVYNQEKYIEDMLKGFLLQDVDFEVEYLIHDDASTDGTVEILQKYQDDYPGKFQIYYEKENQWSKHVKIAQQILLPIAKGEYIAFCEGDDYWVDKNKLREQVNFLEKNTEYVCVAHNALIWECDKNILYAQNNCECSRELTAKDILNRKWPSIATASRMFRREAVTLEGFFLDCGMVGDMPTDFYAFTKGKMYYMDKIMSVYRYRSNGSWTQQKVKNLSELLDWRIIMLDFLKRYDKYTDETYKHFIQAYMSRGIHDILNILIENPINQCEFNNILNIADRDTDYKYTLNIDEIRRQAEILIYGSNKEFYLNLKRIASKKDIYIYGAGKFGNKMAEQLKVNKIDFKAFIVTKVVTEDTQSLGKEIKCIDQYPNNDSSFLIVSISGKIWDEIYETLQIYDVKNYIYPLLADIR